MAPRPKVKFRSIKESDVHASDYDVPHDDISRGEMPMGPGAAMRGYSRAKSVFYRLSKLDRFGTPEIKKAAEAVDSAANTLRKMNIKIPGFGK